MWLGRVIACGLCLSVSSSSAAPPPKPKAATILVHGSVRFRGAKTGIRLVPVNASLDGTPLGTVTTDKAGAFTIRVPPKATLSVHYRDIFGDVQLKDAASEQTIILYVDQLPE